jgi:hypothetical protein
LTYLAHTTRADITARVTTLRRANVTITASLQNRRTAIFSTSVYRADRLYCIKTQLKMTTCAQLQYLLGKYFSQTA